MESGTRPVGGLWLAVGIGVNLAHAPIDSERPATALADHLARRPAAVAARARSRSWPPPSRAGEDVWVRLGFRAIADAWTARAHGLGEACVARLGTETPRRRGRKDWTATARCVFVWPTAQLRRITAGDVFFGGAA